MKIIAECGINWRNLKEAKLMIKKSKEVGCWATKFQLFTKKEAPNLLFRLYLRKWEVAELFNYGKEIGQEVFFTPMYLKAIDWCEDIGVNYYKIRFKDWFENNDKLIAKIMETKKPTFISLNKTVLPRPLHKFLFCVPEYPAYELDYFDSRKNIIPFFNGISDHTKSTDIIRYFGPEVEYIEKHVKLNDDCPESDWSVTFEELAEVLK